MSILGAMYTGTSGLGAEGEALGIVGDNVANSNTIGFKESRAVFENVLGGAIGGQEPGGGVRMTRSQQIFAQGSLLNTGQPTDLALSGDGFFVVNGTVDGVTGNFYTRAGQTSIRQDGTLVNSEGLGIQGYAAAANGQFSSTLSPIQVPTGQIPANPSTKISMQANLDATATAPVLPWDPQNPAATSNFSTSLNVYDSLGNSHSVQEYFTKTGANTWDYHVLGNGSEITGGTPGQNFEFATGSATFNTSGALQSNTLTSGGSVSFIGAKPNQTVALGFGTPTSSGGTGLDGITQFGSPSGVTAQSQDGYASGALSSIKIDGDGTVQGVYTNGQTLPVAKLAVAKFRSNDGLGRVGHNLWIQTPNSGDPAIGSAGTGGRAAVVSGALEQSNVDITQQFVDLISHQRAFEANSKTITTADQMLQTVMNLKSP